MTRSRVTLAYISNDAARKVTFRKRKKGLAKKVSELTTLCGIQACAVIFSPYDARPEVWPNSSGAQEVITRFQNAHHVPDEKRNLNQESFTRQRISKVSAQLKKQRRENHKKMAKLAMFRCIEGQSIDDQAMNVDPDDIDRLAQENIIKIEEKLDEFI